MKWDRGSKEDRQNDIKYIAARLEHTAWSKGGYLPSGRAVPGARPAQIRAAARKLFDQYLSRERKAARLSEAA